ncbi:MAG: DUF86 domain-containing protein [Roseiflexus sp.]|nr:DUF86 domain-containing protein [Roseiflexus sp.]MCS7287830.1 DUF86 domain-containing protein [Roseiflexus sp.]MDW8146994.1 DUF86 domain-containing protein [Roseiflexaceae bacterium]
MPHRFRNLIIHEYARINDAQVYAILQQRLSDFDAFADVVRQYLHGS